MYYFIIHPAGEKREIGLMCREYHTVENGLNRINSLNTGIIRMKDYPDILSQISIIQPAVASLRYRRISTLKDI
jgi:hypothetical protein